VQEALSPLDQTYLFTLLVNVKQAKGVRRFRNREADVET
jgi:hypothetical protein